MDRDRKIYLGIETSTVVCSVALFDQERVLLEKNQFKDRSHSSHLTLMIDAVMKEMEIGWNQLAGVVFSDGPGSYTGLRIGASVAKGICYIHDLPLWRISGLRASSDHSYYKMGSGIHVGVSDARREDIYVVILDEEGQMLVSPRLWNLESDWRPFLEEQRDKDIWVSGAGKEKVLGSKEGWNVTDSRIGHSAANLFYSMIQNPDIQPVNNKMVFEPFYMQTPNITQSKKLTLRK